MSSARGKKNRIPADLYETPEWCTHSLLDAYGVPYFGEGSRWIEPSAGSGAILKAVDSWYSGMVVNDKPLHKPIWTVVEARRQAKQDLRRACELASAGASEIIIDDFLDQAPPAEPFDVMLGNPPYSLAMEFVRKAVEERWAQRVAFLLRIAFLESAGRYEWLTKNMPDVYGLPTRPSFTQGATDSTMYAWLVWSPMAPQVQGKIQLLKPRVRARGFEEVHRA